MPLAMQIMGKMTDVASQVAEKDFYRAGKDIGLVIKMVLFPKPKKDDDDDDEF